MNQKALKTLEYHWLQERFHLTQSKLLYLDLLNRKIDLLEYPQYYLDNKTLDFG